MRLYRKGRPQTTPPQPLPVREGLKNDSSEAPLLWGGVGVGCFFGKSYRKQVGTAWLSLLFLAGCIDPYRPPEIASPDSYLVVNGFFNSAPGTTTTISLSRTQNLASLKASTAETKAQVSIESQSKVVYALKEATTGSYTFLGVVPTPGETYRLHIKTSNGKDYFSDYVPVITTPPIDSVSWQVENDGVQLNVNTHDPKNSTHYYRWEYDETWEFVSAYYSQLELKNNKIVNRTDNIYQCWGNSSSQNIMTGNTSRLSQDVVSQAPLTFVPGNSIKLGIRYSFLVRQYGLSQAGYEYYDQLGKITQNVGSIFDPQPSQITGNIHPAISSSELVLGFFRVGSVESKRMFITHGQLPVWRTFTGYDGCTLDTLALGKIIAQQPNPAIISAYDETRYLTTSFSCADCRQRGTNKRPDFWP